MARRCSVTRVMGAIFRRRHWAGHRATHGQKGQYLARAEPLASNLVVRPLGPQLGGDRVLVIGLYAPVDTELGAAGAGLAFAHHRECRGLGLGEALDLGLVVKGLV
jgi:hypothetical protein